MSNLGFALVAFLALFVALTLSQNADGRCAYCVGKTCGPDGIGGSCGSCPVGQKCNRGSCICDRGCTGRECGPDNCGTTCGDCLTGQTCVNGICTGACTPQCVRTDGTIRTCGWDRCGGCCGDCPEGFRCRDGTCECYPKCENKHCGSDGCGGSCGTCQNGAFCQGDTDKYPGQCYFDCLITIRIEVRERQTENLVTGSCTISVTGPNNYVNSSVIYPGSNPGFVTLDISTGKYGSYSFTTTCTGYDVSTETKTVNATGQLVTLHVDWRKVLIEVRDEDTNQLLPSANIQITATGYSLNVSWVSPSYTWTHRGFMTYTFTTSASGYTTRTVTSTVTASTTLITLFLGKGAIPIRVVECVTNDPVATATITVGSQTINYNNGASFTPTQGFTSYTFTTRSGNYVSNTQTVNVQATTTQIVLCLNYPPINLVVTSCATGAQINGAAIRITSTFYTSYSMSVTYSSSGTTWTPVGYMGNYSFAVSANGYNNKTESHSVTVDTKNVSICLSESAFCGDGMCQGSETANPTSATRCFDCGRLRGVISLAVGQKDQLVNITVSVWPAPTNPATIMRSGQQLPAPAFTTLSDSKGFFSVNTLSFDAPVSSRAAGQYKRRFYFSLTGSFTDRTSGNDQLVNLLALWWNYELTNTQWSGTGDLTNTNNSPSFYFYMTPGFSTADSLIRIILSWGTLISNPSNSIPDLDLVVAGPVEPESMQVFGTGIVNFANKDAHAGASGQILPYCKIITDSAQGFGPEVFDFYGEPGTSSLTIGFSDTYAANAAANAYEIWVDRPNSSPNQDSSFVFIYDTNSFIVVYYNDGRVNQQQLFDQRTGVEYAYGFYNRDQWNRVPTDATMWHIIDISQSQVGVVWQGFPGENNTNDKSEQPGAKYAYNAAFFERTKQVPCGHVAARGANPVYCPATLTYPQSKK